MLPARNRKDFEDIPEEVREQLTFTWLERVDDADSTALEPAKPKAAAESAANREVVSPTKKVPGRGRSSSVSS